MTAANGREMTAANFREMTAVTEGDDDGPGQPQGF